MKLACFILQWRNKTCYDTLNKVKFKSDCKNKMRKALKNFSLSVCSLSFVLMPFNDAQFFQFYCVCFVCVAGLSFSSLSPTHLMSIYLTVSAFFFYVSTTQCKILKLNIPSTIFHHLISLPLSIALFRCNALWEYIYTYNSIQFSFDK